MRVILIVVACLLGIKAAEARPKASPPPCEGFFCPQVDAFQPLRGTKGMRTRVNSATFHQNGVISGRPAGCPARFCGCWASIEVFGRIIPSLNLAANWLKFPRTTAAPGTVAARRGHVFVLKEHRRGDIWLVSDGNSGGRKARIHERSIRGFAIVDPRGSNQYASAF